MLPRQPLRARTYLRALDVGKPEETQQLFNIIDVVGVDGSAVPFKLIEVLHQLLADLVVVLVRN